MLLRKVRSSCNVFSASGTFDCEKYWNRGNPVAAITFRNQGTSNVTIDSVVTIAPGGYHTSPVISGAADLSQYRYTFPADSPVSANQLMIQVLLYDNQN